MPVVKEVFWGWNHLTERDVRRVPTDDKLLELTMPDSLTDDEVFAVLCKSVLEGFITRGCMVWPRPFYRQRHSRLDLRIGQLWLLSTNPTLRNPGTDNLGQSGGITDTAIDAMTVADAILRSTNPGRGYDDRWADTHPRTEGMILASERIRREVVDAHNESTNAIALEGVHLDIL